MGRGRVTAELTAAPATQRAAESTDVLPRRIGILGGTFDPPHVGHLWLATLAADAIGLDRVLFMPAAQPPHKSHEGITSSADRLLMTRLAIAGNDEFARDAGKPRQRGSQRLHRVPPHRAQPGIVGLAIGE